MPGEIAARRVLVVEDDATAHGSLTAGLRGLGLATETVKSGPEALLRLARGADADRGGPIDLVVIASDLAGMGAAALERALRARPETRGLPMVTLPRAAADSDLLRRTLGELTAPAPGLDLGAASARLGLSPAELEELLRGFAGQAETHLAALDRAARNGDATEIRRESHALAGAAGNLGLAGLHRAARALEHAARSGGSELAPLLSGVEREAAAVLAAIGALGTRPSAVTTIPGQPSGEFSESRILVVDDVETNAELLVRALKDHYRLSVALDGESALRSATAEPPDLILLDVMMPGLDGYEVCRRLKRDPATRDVPVVFLSSLDEGRDKAAGFEAGAADYITKPFEMLEVKARVGALLRAKAYQDAMRERLEADLRVAREIQLGLVPRDFDGLRREAGIECSACLEPARAVGGDLYDIFRLADGRVCLVIGDVCGKGIGAALFMVMAVTLTRSIARVSGRPDEILARVNDALAADNPSSTFVTLFCAVLEPETGRLTYASGGHPSPLLLQPGQPPRAALPSEGTLVGILPGLSFPSADVLLAPGDLLVAFTDGVTEAMDPGGSLFGEARLASLLEGARAPDEAVGRILTGVRQFAGTAEQADDIAILAVRYR